LEVGAASAERWLGSAIHFVEPHGTLHAGHRGIAKNRFRHGEAYRYFVPIQPEWKDEARDLELHARPSWAFQ
jgi:hypothetical protein